MNTPNPKYQSQFLIPLTLSPLAAYHTKEYLRRWLVSKSAKISQNNLCSLLFPNLLASSLDSLFIDSYSRSKNDHKPQFAYFYLIFQWFMNSFWPLRLPLKPLRLLQIWLVMNIFPCSIGSHVNLAACAHVTISITCQNSCICRCWFGFPDSSFTDMLKVNRGKISLLQPLQLLCFI